MNKQNGYKCDDIEKLLILDELDASEKSRVTLHLENCKRCRQFASDLENIRTGMDFSTEDSLQPSPHIRTNILERMNQARSTKRRSLTELRWKLKSVLEYRVPVYQAALSGVVVLLIILFLQNPPTELQFVAEDQFITAGQDSLVSVPLNVNIIDNIDSVPNQNGGWNSAEDSVFSRYIFPAM
ncbi:hypothetical protein GF337_00950 [candidate division KSB1 bacterium]|nr:hypothetical protein [candidate division KSB1 bacterium]